MFNFLDKFHSTLLKLIGDSIGKSTEFINSTIEFKFVFEKYVCNKEGYFTSRMTLK